MTAGPQQSLPAARRLLCYYGDDFTGSTDVLEALFRSGLRTILFLEPPTAGQLEEQFRDADCFGVAGVGRSLTPAEMERELRPLFQTLKSAGAMVVHYKICSTFDSSPDVGNIGKAAEIGRDVFGDAEGGDGTGTDVSTSAGTGAGFIPLLVGVPYLKRYTVFGHHYAGAGGTVYRLDRHPTMSRHPVTPMDESDLLLHLSRQTSLRTSLFDITLLSGKPAELRSRLDRLRAAENPALILFDVLDEERLEAAGRLIWEEAKAADGLFVIGSSGVEYALASAWRADGLIERAPREDTGREVSAVDRLLVVSGSCSPVTQRQIAQAQQQGFAAIRIPAEAWILPEQAGSVKEALRREALSYLMAGQSVILYSALGPQDDSIARLREALAAQGLRAEDSSRVLGSAIGALAKELIAAAGLTRLLIAGGDTSGYVTRELGIYAMECRAELEPGGPLCRAYSSDSGIDGLELVLKGGQVGGESFFEHVRLGKVVGEGT
ncbi:four-carbon acid sugar kinase family protein [Paenibacillus chartarius]|uniref:Four-carbon acid sugar kinase family protein n=1 Tax=Paenibacillus chartarius TaxID=747481 RepID=A0ABV6DE05_9BACL